MTDSSEWQGRVGDTWAAEWRRTDKSFTNLTERLLGTLRGLNPSQVLDIGCGAGELSLAIGRGHPGTTIVGVDISPQLVSTAQDRAAHSGNVRFACADAATWQPDAQFTPDLLVSRHGVMFFDDPTAAFTNLAKLAAANGRLCFSCFRSPGLNSFFAEVVALLPNRPASGDPRAPGPFAFADPDHVTAILETSGWCDIRFAKVDFPMIAGVGPDAVDEAVAYFSVIGPAAAAMRELDAAAREKFIGKVRDLTTRHCRENVVSLPAAAWIVSANKA